MMRQIVRLSIVGLMLVVALPGAFAGGTLLGPTPYLSQADSPFALGTGTFCLETFESGQLAVPGVMGDGSPIGSGGNTDSVDGDDGTIDGSGTNGHSYFSGAGATGITFTFDPNGPLGLPTSAGMVWTDGGGGASVTFEAFDQSGTSLGTLTPPVFADFSNTGQTAEDRFFGAVNPTGISAIKLSNGGGGIEVDHLQFDNCAAATTTTTTTIATTSTTLPGGPCAGIPSGATFASVACRLDVLLAAVQAESRLAKIQSKLVKALQTAKGRLDDGQAKCGDSDTKHARKRVQQAAQKLAQFSHRLRSNSTRKQVPADVREPLATTADGIQADAKTLRGQLGCPHA